MDEIQETPNKGTNGITKIVIALLVLAIAAGGGYFLYSQIQWYPALIVTVTTGANETSGAPIITNVTFEQTQVMYKGTNAPTVYPDVSIMVRNNSLLATPVAYWAAVPWNQDEKEGVYKLTVVFRETYTPANNDSLLLSIRLTGFGARILNKKTAFYQWK